MSAESIATTGLSKSYQGRSALRDLTFAARAGEVVGLLGPNGAGKTTTIRLLSTILTPDAGSYHVAGVPHTEPMRIRRHIGVLPESFGDHGHQTGRDHLAFFARLHGANRTDAVDRADRLLAEVGLTDRAGSRISSYSRGMRQRLGIARALVNDPAVLLLDEPGLGLDPAGQRHINALISEVAARRAVTVILSTHSLPDVEQLCSRIVILRAGRTVANGTVAEVTAGVTAPRTARLRVPAAQAESARAAVLGAGVDVLGFEVEEPRLSDAFFAATDAVAS